MSWGRVKDEEEEIRAEVTYDERVTSAKAIGKMNCSRESRLEE
jgi:hypothetical protein